MQNILWIEFNGKGTKLMVLLLKLEMDEVCVSFGNFSYLWNILRRKNENNIAFMNMNKDTEISNESLPKLTVKPELCDRDRRDGKQSRMQEI